MAEAIPSLYRSIRYASSPSISRFSPFHVPSTQSTRRHYIAGSFSPNIRCQAVGLEATPAAAEARRKKNRYEMENLTTWLLKQDQSGNIDAELTVVLSSISLACKQIASLLQRSNIINLTGGQGTINVQGEDQKKLDVISNEVGSSVLTPKMIGLFLVIMNFYVLNWRLY